MLPKNLNDRLLRKQSRWKTVMRLDLFKRRFFAASFGLFYFYIIA